MAKIADAPQDADTVKVGGNAHLRERASIEHRQYLPTHLQRLVLMLWKIVKHKALAATQHKL